jgi:hypothetical protein
VHPLGAFVRNSAVDVSAAGIFHAHTSADASMHPHIATTVRQDTRVREAHVRHASCVRQRRTHQSVNVRQFAAYPESVERTQVCAPAACTHTCADTQASTPTTRQRPSRCVHYSACRRQHIKTQPLHTSAHKYAPPECHASICTHTHPYPHVIQSSTTCALSLFCPLSTGV